MQLPTELFIGAGLAAAVAVAIVVRQLEKGGRGVQRPAPRGPANLRFTCAGCSEQFTHTRRTLGAWEKGTRRFYCNECHKKWRNSQPPQPLQREGSPGATYASLRRNGSGSSSPPFQQRTSARPVKANAGSGCLGMLVLAVAVPIGLAFVVAQYA